MLHFYENQFWLRLIGSKFLFLDLNTSPNTSLVSMSFSRSLPTVCVAYVRYRGSFNQKISSWNLHIGIIQQYFCFDWISRTRLTRPSQRS